jgi:hypothetical protein
LTFLGASSYPSTNNGLESCNKQIKDSHSLRERLPFNQFVQWAEKMVSADWSRGRMDPTIVELKIAPHLYASAYQMVVLERKTFDLNQQQEFVIAASSNLDLERREIKHLARSMDSDQIDSFIAYQQNRFKVMLFKIN